jgi:hypothetical protein
MSHADRTAVLAAAATRVANAREKWWKGQGARRPIIRSANDRDRSISGLDRW